MLVGSQLFILIYLWDYSSFQYITQNLSKRPEFRLSSFTPSRIEYLSPNISLDSIELLITIPTAPRYPDLLLGTLHKLLDNLSDKEKSSTLIVIMNTLNLGEAELRCQNGASAERDDNSYKFYMKLTNELQRDFGTLVQLGLIQLIEPHCSFYSPLFLSNVCKLRKKTFGDSLKRVTWRSKICLDAAYLFNFSLNYAYKYHLRLEDDTPPIDSKNWRWKLVSILEQHPETWLGATFAVTTDWGKQLANLNYFGGGYGLVFEHRSVSNLTRLLFDNFMVAPFDWLIGAWITAKCDEKHLTTDQCFPSKKIFRHSGRVSTKSLDDFDDVESWKKIGCEESATLTREMWDKFQKQFLEY
jgi:hypothetical protein